MNAKMFANPTDGIINGAIFVVAKIVQVDLLFAAIHHKQHRIDAVVNVHIRLPLLSIPKHIQHAGMLTDLPVEIENVSVCVSATQHSYESKNVALKTKSFAISLNQGFAG